MASAAEDFFEVFCLSLQDLGLARRDLMRGYPDAEIQVAEVRLGTRFPQFYRQFLAVMGKGGGGFFVGTDLFPADVAVLMRWQTMGRRMYERTGAPDGLPAEAIVFGHHQGYQFWYFVPRGQDDPAVFYFREGRQAAELKSPTFSAFLQQCAEDDARVKRHLEETELKLRNLRLKQKLSSDSSGTSAS